MAIVNTHILKVFADGGPGKGLFSKSFFPRQFYSIESESVLRIGADGRRAFYEGSDSTRGNH